jgi:hypothetical protein
MGSAQKQGLAPGIHLIFTAAYQRQIRSSDYTKILTETFRERIGSADFLKVSEFGTWVANHPKHRDIYCYLLDKLEQKMETETAHNARSVQA